MSGYPTPREAALRYGGDGRKNGGEYKAKEGCPLCGGTLKFKDRSDNSPGLPLFTCYGAGCDRKALAKRIAAEFGLTRSPRRGGDQAKPSNHARQAHESKPQPSDDKVKGQGKSPVERFASAKPLDLAAPQPYLLKRGIDATRFPGGLADTLRLAPHAWKDGGGRWRPALVAALRDNAGLIRATLTTYLTADSASKRDDEPQRRTQGKRQGAAIRIGPASETIVICEGLEDAMTIGLALNMTTRVCAIAGHDFTNFIPPDDAREIVVVADRDKATASKPDGVSLTAARKAAAVLAKGGARDGAGDNKPGAEKAVSDQGSAADAESAVPLEIRIAMPPQGEAIDGKPIKDMNDCVRGKQGEAQAEGFRAVKRAIEAAVLAPMESDGEAVSDSDADDAKELSDAEFDARLAEAAKLDETQYLRRRAKLAKGLGVAASVLDRLIKTWRAAQTAGDGLPGQPLIFDAIEPWPHAVDGAALLDELSAAIGRYVIMTPQQRDAVTLWAVFAHAHNLRNFAPLLIAKSAVKRSGKSLLAEVLERLVPRPLYIAGTTAAFIERAVDEHRCTLIIDEADRLRKGDQAMTQQIDAQLNRSFKRRGARTGKNVPLPGGGYEPRLFSTWAPTFIGGIGDQADTAEDRAVIINLRRKLVSEWTAPLRDEDGGDLVILGRQIARFVADNEDQLRTIKPPALDVDNDRLKDAWEPLLAVADVAGGDWPRRARAAGITLCGSVDEREQIVTVQLLADIRDIFDGEIVLDKEGEPIVDLFTREPQREGGEGERIATKRLLEKLCALDERPWPAWGKARKPITDLGLAKLLRPYGIRSGTIRLAEGVTAKGYHRRAFADAFARYLPTSPVSTRHTVTSGGKQGDAEDSQPVTKEKCDGLKKPGKANVSAGWDCVTGSKGGYGDKKASEADSDVVVQPGIIVAAAREIGVVFTLSPERDLFTLEWRGPHDALIADAIRDNYEAILGWLTLKADGDNDEGLAGGVAIDGEDSR